MTRGQAVIPPPGHNYPDCPLCWKETTHDGDTLICQPCGIGWPDDWSHPGFRLDDTDTSPQCTAEISPFAGTLTHIRYRCVYVDGHVDPRHAGGRIDEHGGPYKGAHCWSDPKLQGQL